MLAAAFNPRIDGSDVVQEVLVEACRRGENFLLQRPMPLEDWLIQLLKQKHVDLIRYHIRSQRRSVNRERLFTLEESVSLWSRIAHHQSTPDSIAMGREKQERISLAISTLPLTDQRVLRLRVVEQLSSNQIAEVLAMTASAVSKRYLRALCKLRVILGEESQETGSQTYHE